MADLIDRKELRDALYEADAVTMQGVKIINQFPAVNAVPVVRCRECKHAWVHPGGYVYCNMDGRSAHDRIFSILIVFAPTESERTVTNNV